MSHMPKLDGAPINLAALREHMRQELMECLDSVTVPEGGPGKALVLDPELSGPLGLIAEVKEFKEHGVEKIYHLLSEPLVSDARALIFFVRPHIPLAEKVAAQVQQLERGRADGSGARRSYHLFFVPRRSMVCERVLQEEGVYGLVRATPTLTLTLTMVRRSRSRGRNRGRGRSLTLSLTLRLSR